MIPSHFFHPLGTGHSKGRMSATGCRSSRCCLSHRIGQRRNYFFGASPCQVTRASGLLLLLVPSDSPTLGCVKSCDGPQESDAIVGFSESLLSFDDPPGILTLQSARIPLGASTLSLLIWRGVSRCWFVSKPSYGLRLVFNCLHAFTHSLGSLLA